MNVFPPPSSLWLQRSREAFPVENAWSIGLRLNGQGVVQSHLLNTLGPNQAQLPGLEREIRHPCAFRMAREQIERADLRLAYVQHPVPAQGVTADTAHVIVAEHATAEGTYVALTRARERTDIHVGEEMLLDSELEPMERLAERVGLAETDVPSIAVQLLSGLEHEYCSARPSEPRQPELHYDVGWER